MGTELVEVLRLKIQAEKEAREEERRERKQMEKERQEMAQVLYKSACQQQERLSVVQVSMSATGEAKCCTSQHVSNRRG